MTKLIILKKAKLLSAWTLTMLSLVMLIAFPKDIRNGGTNGVFLCIQVLIPSLFPFMVLSDFIVRSGLSCRTPSFFSHLSNFLFALPKEALSVIALSMIGGYPVGAKGIKALFDEKLIDETDAKRMSLCLVGAGPGFLLTFMGSVMLRDNDAGYILLIAQTITIAVTAVLSRLFCKKGESANHEKHRKVLKFEAGALIESVSSAIKSISLLCGLVIIFSSVCEVYLSLIGGNIYLRPLCAILEITTGGKILSEGYSLPLISFFAAFGGLCVHLQIHSLLSPVKVSKLSFFLWRVASGLISMGICSALLRLSKRSSYVFSSVTSTSPEMSASVFGSIMLIIFSLLFLLSMRNHKNILKNHRR